MCAYVYVVGKHLHSLILTPTGPDKIFLLHQIGEYPKSPLIYDCVLFILFKLEIVCGVKVVAFDCWNILAIKHFWGFVASSVAMIIVIQRAACDLSSISLTHLYISLIVKLAQIPII